MKPCHASPQRTNERRSIRLQDGFTLAELLTTLAVAAILMALAAPSFSRLIAKQRSRSAAADLYITLAKARSEAIKRNTDVTLLPVTAGAWQNGWKILDPSDTTLTRKLDDHGAVTNATISGPVSIIYQSTGRIKGSTAPVFNINVTGADGIRCVSADLSGRPYQAEPPC